MGIPVWNEVAWIKNYIWSWTTRESPRELILDHVHAVGISITLLVLYQITLQTLSCRKHYKIPSEKENPTLYSIQAAKSTSFTTCREKKHKTIHAIDLVPYLEQQVFVTNEISKIPPTSRLISQCHSKIISINNLLSS